MAYQIAASLVLLAPIVFVWLLPYLTRTRHRLPPGPPGLPVLGNINDLPPPGRAEYLHWLKHKDEHGPISSLSVLGQTIILLHDRDMAIELLEKRAAIHSGRPTLKFGSELTGWGELLGQVQNDETHRLYRKYAYKQLGSKAAVARYHAMQEASTGRALWRIKQNGGRDLAHDLKTQTGGLILKVLYDYTIDQNQADPLVALNDSALDQLSQAIVPGRWLVDVLPILAHVPEWFPGAGFQTTARLWKKNLLKTVDVPYNFAKKREIENSTEMSFVARAVNQAKADNGGAELTKEQERAIKYTAVSLNIGGQDTSALTTEAMYLAMSMFPEVQRKAQEEIDRIVGRERLPTADDRDNLPYINAVIEEAIRWHPIAPLGLPHASDREDTINAYRIPKGSILVPNVWWFLHDPAVYHEPEAFIPDRYMAPFNEPSPMNVAFGFGRRVCPGRVLAKASLFLTFAQTLAVFDIRPRLDSSGKEFTNIHTILPGMVGKLGPFEVTVKPRSEAHGVLVEQHVRKFVSEESNARSLQGLTG